MQAHTAMGQTLYFMGEFLAAKEHLDNAISLYDPERPLPFRNVRLDSEAFGLSYAAWTLWQLGYPDQALARGNEALAFAQGLSHPHTLALAGFVFSGALRQFRREASAAQENAESGIALAAEHGLTDPLASATILRGWAMAQQGRNDQGIALIMEGLARIRATGLELSRRHWLSLLAEACGETGRLDEGLSALMEALAGADEHEDQHYEAEIHRLKGELLLKQNNSNA
jgi:predicted ATPase